MNIFSTKHLCSRTAWLIAVLATVLPLQLRGQTSPDEAGRHMIWRVESDSNVVFVAGSVHALPKNVYPLPSVFYRAFDSASTLVLELELGAEAMASMQQVLFQKGMLQGKETLQNRISKSTYASLKKRLKEVGLDVAMFSKFKPWVVGMMLMAFSMDDSGVEAQHGLDLHFQQKASSAGIPVIGLETIDMQISLFDGMSAEAQEQFLIQQLTSHESGSEELMKIIGSWRRGDAAALDNTLGAEMRGDSVNYERLVSGRNRAWIPQIERFLADHKPYMVVVGALHLVGDDGVIELLRRKGYRVEQL